MRLRCSKVAVLLLLPTVVVGCATASTPTDRREVNLGYRSLGDGVVLTRDVQIIDEKGAFELQAGQPWPVPFDLGDECVLNPDASDPGAAMLTGARHVRVVVPQVEEPLYGLLQLCGAPPEATGPATRRYNVEVPQSYVDRTAGGLVSVVYEPHQGKWAYGSPKAWSLWLSRSPFPQPAARSARVVTARSAAEAQANAAAKAARPAPAKNSEGDTLLIVGGSLVLAAILVGGIYYAVTGELPFLESKDEP